mmetsp:Transcript_119250/g.186130  ORF Transcript_119250/g.186130 Transcript_119250/m.186130 type:complete len:131 (+) Transcript_119250:41-433(+)
MSVEIIDSDDETQAALKRRQKRKAEKSDIQIVTERVPRMRYSGFSELEEAAMSMERDYDRAATGPEMPKDFKPPKKKKDKKKEKKSKKKKKGKKGSSSSGSSSPQKIVHTITSKVVQRPDLASARTKKEA